MIATPRAPDARPAHVWVAAACLAFLASAASLSTASGQTHEPLGFSRADPRIILAQIDLSATYLTAAISALETAATSDELQEVSSTCYQAYRLLRFASEGLRALTSRPYANPVYQLVHVTVDQARFSIIHARLALGAAARWPEERQSQIAEALSKLRQAIALADQAKLLM